MLNRPLIVGSRGSELALWQAHFVIEQLRELGVSTTLKIIKTQGDKVQHLSFDKMEGKGFFTKEIEEALLDKSIDLAVHSHKDLETTNPEGLMIAAVSYRANPRDVLLIRNEKINTQHPLSLPKGAIVGTSSARRKAQILSMHSAIEIKDIRGNVPTRIAKLQAGDFDAILMAAAGLERIKPEREGLTLVELNPVKFIPAPAQGVLGYQIRTREPEVEKIVLQLHHADVEECIAIERGILKNLNGGCQMPLGAYCIKENDQLKVYVSFAKAWNSPTKNYLFDIHDPVNDPRKIAEQIKEES